MRISEIFDLEKIYDQLTDLIMACEEASDMISKSLKDSMSPSELTAGIRSLAAAESELIELRKAKLTLTDQASKLEKQLAQEIEKGYSMQEEANRETQRAVNQKKEYNKETQRQIEQERIREKAMAKLDSILKAEAKTEGDLRRQQAELIKMQQSLRITVDAEREARDKIIAKINANKAALKAMTDETSRQRDNVGNYKSALDGLSDGSLKARTAMMMMREQMIALELQMENGVALTEEQSREYNNLSLAMGQMKDIMGDVDARTKALADDYRGMTTALEAMKLSVNVFGALKGVMALVGKENENLLKVLTELQAVMTLTNTLSEIQNSLNKDSALMTNLRVASETKLTNATLGQTIAVKAQSAAYKTLNAVKKAGLPLLALLGAAIAGVTKVISKNREETKRLREEEEARKVSLRAAIDAERELERAEGPRWLRERREEAERLAQAYQDIASAAGDAFEAESRYNEGLDNQAKAETLKDFNDSLTQLWVSLEQASRIGRKFEADRKAWLTESGNLVRETIRKSTADAANVAYYFNELRNSLNLETLFASDPESDVKKAVNRYIDAMERAFTAAKDRFKNPADSPLGGIMKMFDDYLYGTKKSGQDVTAVTGPDDDALKKRYDSVKKRFSDLIGKIKEESEKGLNGLNTVLSDFQRSMASEFDKNAKVTQGKFDEIAGKSVNLYRSTGKGIGDAFSAISEEYNALLIEMREVIKDPETLDTMTNQLETAFESAKKSLNEASRQTRERLLLDQKEMASAASVFNHTLMLFPESIKSMTREVDEYLDFGGPNVIDKYVKPLILGENWEDDLDSLKSRYYEKAKELEKTIRETAMQAIRTRESIQPLIERSTLPMDKGGLTVDEQRQLKETLAELYDTGKWIESMSMRVADLYKAATADMVSDAFKGAADIMQGAYDILDSLVSLTEKRLERESRAYEKAYNTRKGYIEKNVKDEEEKNRKLEALEAEKLAQEEALERKREQMEARQAAFRSGIALTEGVSKAAGAVGELMANSAGNVVNFIAALAAGMAAVGQLIAFIGSIRELSKFEKGGDAPVNMPFIAGEKGFEIGKGLSGRRYEFSNPGIYTVPEPVHIYNHSESVRMERTVHDHDVNLRFSPTIKVMDRARLDKFFRLV